MHRLTLEDFLTFLRKSGFNPRTCIDVGTANGTYEIYRAFPKARHVLVEALREFEPDLKTICARFDATYFLGAAGGKDGTITFNVHKDLFGSSLLAEEEGAHVDGEPRTVPIRPVDSITAELGAGGPYLLKVDVQGAELEVLKGCKGILKEVEVIILETSLFNFFKNGPLLSDVMAIMDRAGFVPYDIFGQLYRLVDGALAQVDVAFVKREGMFRTTHVYATPEQREQQNLMMAQATARSAAPATTDGGNVRNVLTLLGHASIRRALRVPLPVEATVDMGGAAVAHGWYTAETDPHTGLRFRWLGPKPTAKVEVLVRRDRDLYVDIHVVHALYWFDLDHMRVEVDGRVHETWAVDGVPGMYRFLLAARDTESATGAPTTLTFRLPHTHSPSERDVRRLSIGVASIRLAPVETLSEEPQSMMTEIELPAVNLTPPKQQEIRAALSAYLSGFVDHAHFPTEEEFDEARYLALHPDVAGAVAAGTFPSGYEHFKLHGSAEGRRFELCGTARNMGT